MSKNPASLISFNITRTEGEVQDKARIKNRQKAGPNVGPNAKIGPMNRKQKRRLDVRRLDYSTMMSISSDPTGRKGSGGFHRPGSNQ